MIDVCIIRLESLKLAYRHDLPATDIVNRAKIFENYIAQETEQGSNRKLDNLKKPSDGGKKPAA
jgi:hypothetical protein